jgi:hypothetical protein
MDATKSLIVDTNVFVDCCTLEKEWALNCAKIVLKIHDGDVQIGVDSEGKIIKEYMKNLGQYDRKNIIATTIIQIIRSQKTSSKSIKSYIPIPEKKVNYLIKNGFHENDIIFVRIAPLSTLKMIISSDGKSFNNRNFKEWIAANLKVDIKTPSEYDEIRSKLETDSKVVY